MRDAVKVKGPTWSHPDRLRDEAQAQIVAVMRRRTITDS